MLAQVILSATALYMLGVIGSLIAFIMLIFMTISSWALYEIVKQGKKLEWLIGHNESEKGTTNRRLDEHTEWLKNISEDVGEMKTDLAALSTK